MGNDKAERRQFLGLALCCLGGATCGRLLAADQNAKKDSDSYEMTAYCCQRCDKCELYRFRQCNTCKFSKIAVGGCEIKKCAVAKGVLTCGHCDDLATCDKEFWKKRPDLKKLAGELQAQLRAGKQA